LTELFEKKVDVVWDTVYVQISYTAVLNIIPNCIINANYNYMQNYFTTVKVIGTPKTFSDVLK